MKPLAPVLSLGLSLSLAPAFASPLGTLGKGITAADAATGSGYILYSPAALTARFTLPADQSAHFAAVYHSGGSWYYYNDETAVAFTPVATDVLVASVDYSADTATLLTGQRGSVEGIQKGYTAGDLAVTVNWYDGVSDPGEFTVTGTNITLNTPVWWAARAVTDSDPAQNLGVANLGQLKHVATQAHAELEGLLPGGAGFALPFAGPPANPDAAWYRDQKKALNLGQLKAVALPFYDKVNSIATTWPQTQFGFNGLATLGTDYFQGTNNYYYPWDPTTPVAENYKAATVGQVKLVYALRFRDSEDGDAAPDLMELAVFGDTDEVITSVHDLDGNGFVNFAELASSYGLPGSDSDMDGVGDSDELAAGTDPNHPDNPAVGLMVEIIVQ